MKFLALILMSSSAALATPTLTLTSTNHVALRGEVTEGAVEPIISKLMSLPPNVRSFYIYIDSPGGSVIAGNRLIETLHTTEVRTVCVAAFAASMAFSILQAGDERVVLESSILMQHEASYSVSGPAPHNVSMVNFLQSMLRIKDEQEAARVRLTYSQYRAKIRDDWWIYGTNNITARTADRLSRVTCSMDLITRKISLITFGFLGLPSKQIVSACPILTSPIIVNSDQIRQLNTIYTGSL